MPASFARETITRLRYPTVFDHGRAVLDTSGTPDALDIGRCWCEPTSSTEDNVNRTTVSTGWTVNAPANVDVLASDHVRYRGLEYLVIGEPQPIPSPTGALASTRIYLQRWEG